MRCPVLEGSTTPLVSLAHFRGSVLLELSDEFAARLLNSLSIKSLLPCMADSNTVLRFGKSIVFLGRSGRCKGCCARTHECDSHRNESLVSVVQTVIERSTKARTKSVGS